MHIHYELAPLKLKGRVREPTRKELENFLKYLGNNEIKLVEKTKLNRLSQVNITKRIKILKHLATRAPPKRLLSLKSASFQTLITYLRRHEESHLKGLNVLQNGKFGDFFKKLSLFFKDFLSVGLRKELFCNSAFISLNIL
ncbi:MAG: hypothetical protein B6D56_05655 [Candidatus Omnitrophica bacterium 4484_70.1]|nr:MAG: hypothetical protein B6D56_05655 [Candidatus Omnitrophica bacterium 4484_70.1]